MTADLGQGGRQDALPSFSDPLASALWRARQRAAPLEAAEWPGLTVQRGETVAGELYSALRAAGQTLRGAKLGVTDERAQRNLGADGPMVAPIYDGTTIADEATISLAELVEPKLEAEFGVCIERGELRAAPCVEVIDSRWRGGVTIAHMIADFGWQARMLFGASVAPPAEIEVVVRRDGEELARGRRSLAEATAAVALARTQVDELDQLPVACIATGTIVPAQPLSRGRWSVDFGELGTLALAVED